MLNKRESRRVKEPLRASLVSYGACGPGIKDGFTREKRGRVSLHLVVMLRRGGKEICARGKSGSGDERRRERKREAGGGEGE